MSRKKEYVVISILLVFLIILEPVVCFAESAPPSYDGSLYTVQDMEYSNQYKIAVYTAKKYYPDEYFASYTTFSCDGEICVYTEEGNYYLVSFSPFSVYKKLINCDSGSIEENNPYHIDGSVSNGYGDSWYYLNIGSYGGTYLGHEGVMYSEVKVFDSGEHAYAYLKNGITDGLLTDVMHEYDAEQIYLDNFQMVVHDSNDFDSWYVEFFYTPSKVLLKNGHLQVECSYDQDYEFMLGDFSFDAFKFDGVYDIDLNTYPNSFKIYLSEILVASGPFKEFYKRAALGKEVFIDLSELSIGSVSAEAYAKIVKSNLNFDIVPYIDTSYGKSYQAYVDLLKPSNSYSDSSTPDSVGNYTPDGSPQQNDGYYYTDVQKDAQGNNIYNYYYINNNGLSTPVMDTGEAGGSGANALIIRFADDLRINLSGNIDMHGAFGGGSPGDNIVIEDDDYTDSSLRKDLAEGWGLMDDISTDDKNDGYLVMLYDFYGSIDPDLKQVLSWTVTGVCIICLIWAIRGR